jgi:pimeloyl-CoA synthetase
MKKRIERIKKEWLDKSISYENGEYYKSAFIKQFIQEIDELLKDIKTLELRAIDWNYSDDASCVYLDFRDYEQGKITKKQLIKYIKQHIQNTK